MNRRHVVRELHLTHCLLHELWSFEFELFVWRCVLALTEAVDAWMEGAMMCTEDENINREDRDA